MLLRTALHCSKPVYDQLNWVVAIKEMNSEEEISRQEVETTLLQGMVESSAGKRERE